MHERVSDEGRSDLSLLVDDDEHPVAGRARHRRRHRARGVLTALIALVVLGGLLLGVLLGGRAILDVFSDVPDYTGAGSGAVEVRVNPGDTTADIATALLDAGVIRSERAFREAAAEDPDSLSIQPGLYTMREQMPATLALGLLLDPGARLVESVTIPEGFSLDQILARLSEGTQIPLQELQTAAAQVDQLGLPAWAGGRLEGFLFPSTYEFDPRDDALTVLQSVVGQFVAVTDRIQLETRATAAGVAPYDIVVIASMIQSESRIDGERPRIARVIYNRLAQGIPLGIDATTAYDLGKSGTDLTTADFQIDSPYNTRINPGVPPTPISSPGEVSLEAALAPEAGNWIYYVLSDAEGNHFFTASAAEFEAAKAQCARLGLGCG